MIWHQEQRATNAAAHTQFSKPNVVAKNRLILNILCTYTKRAGTQGQTKMQKERADDSKNIAVVFKLITSWAGYQAYETIP